MNWITVFLGIIAFAEIGALILNVSVRVWQKSYELLSRQLERERERYDNDRKQLEKDIVTSKDAINLWSKKYFELEILLKKAEHKEPISKEEDPEYYQHFDPDC